MVVLGVPAQAGVAQLVEQLIRNQQVTSSSLVAGSRNLAIASTTLVATARCDTISLADNRYRCDPLRRITSDKRVRSHLSLLSSLRFCAQCRILPRTLTSRHKQTDRALAKPDWILTGVIIDWPDGMPAALSQTAWVETPLGWT